MLLVRVGDTVLGIHRWNRSHDRIVWACDLRNCAQVGPVRRGVGSIPAVRRIFHMVEAPVG